MRAVDVFLGIGLAGMAASASDRSEIRSSSSRLRAFGGCSRVPGTASLWGACGFMTRRVMVFLPTIRKGLPQLSLV